MSFRQVGLSSSVNGSDQSPPDFNETPNGFINKAANSLVYKSMAVLLSIHLDVASIDGTWKPEYSVGDEIGRILKMIGLVLAVTCAISFVLIPFTVAVVLCCCKQPSNSGTRALSYSPIRKTKKGNSGKDYSKSRSRRPSCGKTYLIGVLFGIPAGIVVGIITGVNTWPYM
ncbi:uncharacterized protein LOC130700237 [Daphnia carinata]|uniref:uncharacterized protein LOC130700237 n=1 Tax=Daphnia carinata TaxID=120202 RepID=UPI0025809F0E|nr:uncharacterized protein LOC130700237 [Daphnia carinata]